MLRAKRTKTKWMFNVVTGEQRILSKYEDCPDGWRIGFFDGNNKMRNSRKVTNGFEDIYVPSNLTKPDGWFYTKKDKTKRQIRHKKTRVIAYLEPNEKTNSNWEIL